MSACPCIIKVGHRTRVITSELTNLSRTKREATLPSRDRTADFKDVYGDSKIKQDGFDRDAKWQAGPVPIDRPNRMMSLGSNLRLSVTKSKTF